MEKVMEYLCYHGVNIDSNSGNKMLNRSEMRAKALDMIENTRKDTCSNTRLTKVDGIAWWKFISLCLPINYERALIHRKIKEDMIIGDLDGIERLNINDYFELYNLPRVTAENGIISVNGIPKVRYANRMNYFRERNIFTIAHHDKRFYVWKKVQLEKCQNGHCAWCNKLIKTKEAEVDHVLPLIFFGKNEPWNMVVCCKDCNKMKAADVSGWNEGGDRLIRNKKPSWIKKNSYDALMKKVLIEAEKKYDDEKEEERGAVMYVRQRVAA